MLISLIGNLNGRVDQTRIVMHVTLRVDRDRGNYLAGNGSSCCARVRRGDQDLSILRVSTRAASRLADAVCRRERFVYIVDASLPARVTMCSLKTPSCDGECRKPSSTAYSNHLYDEDLHVNVGLPQLFQWLESARRSPAAFRCGARNKPYA